MTLGSLYIKVQGYVPVFLENLNGMSALELIGPWLDLGFSVGMEALDELLLIYVLRSQEFSGVLKFWI